MEQIFIYLEKHGNEDKFLNRIKRTKEASNQESKGKNIILESKDIENQTNDYHSELPSPPTELLNPLVYSNNQTFPDIDPSNIIEQDPTITRFSIPERQTNLCIKKNFQLKNENNDFGKLTVGHLLLVERKLLFCFM